MFIGLVVKIRFKVSIWRYHLVPGPVSQRVIIPPWFITLFIFQQLTVIYNQDELENNKSGFSTYNLRSQALGPVPEIHFLCLGPDIKYVILEPVKKSQIDPLDWFLTEAHQLNCIDITKRSPCYVNNLIYMWN